MTAEVFYREREMNAMAIHHEPKPTRVTEFSAARTMVSAVPIGLAEQEALSQTCE